MNRRLLTEKEKFSQSVHIFMIKHNHLDFCTYEFEEYIGLLPLISSNP